MSTRTFNFATIANVVDGDTCDILVDLGFTVRIKTRFRLSGIDTPEKGQPGWAEATNFLKTFLDKQVIVVSTKTDKYGRYLAEIYLKEDVNLTQSINSMLLQKSLAVVYT